MWLEDPELHSYVISSTVGPFSNADLKSSAPVQKLYLLSKIHIRESVIRFIDWFRNNFWCSNNIGKNKEEKKKILTKVRLLRENDSNN